MHWHEEFPIDPSIAYLNHAAVAPWPKRTADTVKAFADKAVRQGALEYGKWLGVEASLRERLKQLINARSIDEIALLKSTSEGLSVVAQGLPWEAGDNVVIPAHEFPSNRIVWESLADRGVEVRYAEYGLDRSLEESILALVDNCTRLVSVSSVQYATGLRADLAALGRFCEDREVLFCVDAIQSIGALPFDVREARADFVVADAHKWMLGPEGIALFYCRKELIPEIKLYQHGWHMVEHAGDFGRTDWEPAHSARRFECGSPNMLGIHALDASLSLMLEVGIESIVRNIFKKTEYLHEIINKKENYSILSPWETRRRSGIVSFTSRSEADEAVFKRLTDAGVLCALRGGGIRFSPHFYTPKQALDQALDAL